MTTQNGKPRIDEDVQRAYDLAMLEDFRGLAADQRAANRGPIYHADQQAESGEAALGNLQIGDTVTNYNQAAQPAAKPAAKQRMPAWMLLLTAVSMGVVVAAVVSWFRQPTAAPPLPPASIQKPPVEERPADQDTHVPWSLRFRTPEVTE